MLTKKKESTIFEEKYIIVRINNFLQAFKMNFVKEIINDKNFTITQMPGKERNLLTITERGILNIAQIKNIEQSITDKLLVLLCGDKEVGIFIDEVINTILITNPSEITQGVIKLPDHPMALITECSDIKIPNG